MAVRNKVELDSGMTIKTKNSNLMGIFFIPLIFSESV